MLKKLTKTGNSLALVLDKPLLDRAGIEASTPLEVSTDGEVIVISPVRDRRRTARVRRIAEDARRRYGGVFRRLMHWGAYVPRPQEPPPAGGDSTTTRESPRRYGGSSAPARR